MHKDRWEEAIEAGHEEVARAHLRHAIDAYKRGFESDWRDAYPGVNALTLLEVQEPGQSEFARLLPVVRYAIEQRLASGAGDYWDHASLLEVAVLGDDLDTARSEAGECLAMNPAEWQIDTTIRNIEIIGRAKGEGGEVRRVADEVVRILS